MNTQDLLDPCFPWYTLYSRPRAVMVERVIKVILFTNPLQTPFKLQNVPPKSVASNFLTARSVLNQTEPSGS